MSFEIASEKAELWINSVRMIKKLFRLDNETSVGMAHHVGEKLIAEYNKHASMIREKYDDLRCVVGDEPVDLSDKGIFRVWSSAHEAAVELVELLAEYQLPDDFYLSDSEVVRLQERLRRERSQLAFVLENRQHANKQPENSDNTGIADQNRVGVSGNTLPTLPTDPKDLTLIDVAERLYGNPKNEQERARYTQRVRRMLADEDCCLEDNGKTGRPRRVTWISFMSYCEEHNITPNLEKPFFERDPRFDLEEAAGRLKISQQEVIEYIESGKLEADRIMCEGQPVYSIDPESLMVLIESRNKS